MRVNLALRFSCFFFSPFPFLFCLGYQLWVGRWVKMADKRGANQAKLQALTSSTKKKSPFQKQIEQIEAKKKVRVVVPRLCSHVRKRSCSESI